MLKFQNVHYNSVCRRGSNKENFKKFQPLQSCLLFSFSVVFCIQITLQSSRTPVPPRRGPAHSPAHASRPCGVSSPQPELSRSGIHCWQLRVSAAQAQGGTHLWMMQRSASPSSLTNAPGHGIKPDHKQAPAHWHKGRPQCALKEQLRQI